MSCNICFNEYTNEECEIKCRPVTCGFCDFTACNNCCETYILDQTVPKCMNAACGKDWSRKFMRAQLGGTFMTGRFKTHMENVLYEREKSLLPATQPLIEGEVRKNKLQKEKSELTKQIKELQSQIDELKSRRDEIDIEKNRLNRNTDNFKPKEKIHYVRACPAVGCRGFLNSQFNCGLCDANVCKSCHEIINVNSASEHVCKEENVATAQLLEKETKPCPGCQTRIFKISGCDQIWCTHCHTAFSWRTGARETEIHNPHYYEWRRANGERNVLTEREGVIRVGCHDNTLNHRTYDQLDLAVRGNRHIDLRWLEQDPYSKYSQIAKYDPNYKNMSDIIRHFVHNHEYELNRFRSDITKNNEKWRIQFLSNEISEEKFKTMIQRNDKKSRKEGEIYDILQFAETTMTDIVYRMIDDLSKTFNGKHKFQELYKEIEGLREYCNNAFKEISETYDCIVHSYGETFGFA